MPKTLLILVNKDNKFLSKQYIDYIVNNNLNKVNYINSLFELTDSAFSLLSTEIEFLNILRTDVFNDKLPDYSQITNTIVICESVDKTVLPAVQEYIIQLPSFEEWQIKDYMQVIAPGLGSAEINWLYNVTKGDIFWIDNELAKVNLFSSQIEMLNELRYEHNSVLYNLSSWDLFAAIINNDKVTVLEALRHRSCVDLTGFFLITSLLTKFKQLLFLRCNSGLKLENIGISSGAAYHLNHDYKNIPEHVLLCLIDFLSGLDQQIKLGELDFKTDALLVDYVLCKVFEILG